MEKSKRISPRIQDSLFGSWPTIAGIVTLVAVLLLLSWSLARVPRSDTQAADRATAPAGPPWCYGDFDARFTLIEYADLECPYCRAYFPVLMRWIDANPDVNWQWRHLPLAMHGPSALQDARLAECAGETGGHVAFWTAVAWIYRQSRGDGLGLPLGVELPGATSALRDCLASTRPDAVIRAQVEEADRLNIAATPTLHLVDNWSGQSLLLPAGPIEGDALLSAIDLLASRDASSTTEVASELIETSDVPADTVSDTPR
jgi:protein-disulfide isomerase